MHVVVVRFQIHRKHVEDFRQAILAQADNALAHEVGCLQFDVCEVPGEPTQFLLYEVYESPEAFNLHQQMAHTRNFRQCAASWIADRQLETFNLISAIA